MRWTSPSFVDTAEPQSGACSNRTIACTIRHMSFSSSDRLFVEKRDRLARSWPVVGVVLLALLAGFCGWLWLRTPYLINPWAVFESLRAGTLPESTANLMVAMLPIVMLTLLFFAFVVVLLFFVAFSNERRLIRLIRELEQNSADDPSSECP